jgi:hypothetical protein
MGEYSDVSNTLMVMGSLIWFRILNPGFRILCKSTYFKRRALSCPGCWVSRYHLCWQNRCPLPINSGGISLSYRRDKGGATGWIRIGYVSRFFFAVW